MTAAVPTVILEKRAVVFLPARTVW